MNRTMKIFGLCVALVAVAALAAVNPCAAQTTNRPLSDFLSTQGTSSNFNPPIPDFWGWTNNSPLTLFAGVDYAGLALRVLPNLGTVVTGGITETLMPDGTYEVTVNCNAKNANAWVCPFPSDPATQPTVFGSRPADFLTNPNAPKALVNSSLKWTFTATMAGAPIPDMVYMDFSTLKSIKFGATGTGQVPGGGTAKLTITEVGLLTTGFHGAVGDGFPAEKITIK